MATRFLIRMQNVTFKQLSALIRHHCPIVDTVVSVDKQGEIVTLLIAVRVDKEAKKVTLLIQLEIAYC